MVYANMSYTSSTQYQHLTFTDSVKSAMLKRLLGSGSYESFDLRCMVTGQFSVGKSSLVKLLVGDVIQEGSHPTDGIFLIEGRCGLDIENRNWIMIDPGKKTYIYIDVKLVEKRCSGLIDIKCFLKHQYQKTGKSIQLYYMPASWSYR